ncbi:RNA polymerase sigma factor [Aquimarina sp. 2201CG14-23]|uniref:RNA polymerase sigma factor n=1 Tax=Aquimarina mycalae TaxID=3040073 RepID=UPI0024780440|nr:RNA polymerase sigma factor [Aquimarina sp. 2201CG14-23]MDH7448187.1 RNA polymerase sigma factor [Aquimarina sp. 2201CG14-23]
MGDTLETLVKKANLGDRNALELVVLKTKDYVYNLSLKMLLYPEDAEDATQEILIKVITHLSTFNYRSKFMTWIYRVATNYLLTYKSQKNKEFAMPFDDYANLIDTGQSDTIRYSTNEGELSLLEEEVKVSCTQGLLLCLNSVDRMVYILSEILEFNSVEGSQIMEITAENFRKKLSRSRTKIRNFLNNKCGLANPKNPCRCNKKIDFLIEQKIINSKDLRFAGFSQRSIDLVGKLSELEKSIAIYRSVPQAEAPMRIFNNIKQTLALD